MTPLSDCTDGEIETVFSSENRRGKYQRRGRLSRKQAVIAVIVTVLLAVVVGFLIGYFVPKSKPAASVINASREDVHGKFEDVHGKFEDGVSATKLEEEFR